MKLHISVKLLNGKDVVEETAGVFDLNNVPADQVRGLVAQLRRLFRRELIRRGLIVQEEEDGRKR